MDESKYDIRVMRHVVGLLLARATEIPWTLQGLGMLRFYINKELRLHIWDDRYAVPEVSVMHTHPWHLRSRIIAGSLVNTLFREDPQGQPHKQQKLHCGQGGGLVGKPTSILLKKISQDRFGVGDVYAQKAHEIHVSTPQRGTVTLVERTMTEDTEHAYVFWPDGTNWVSAEPRSATKEEVSDIVGYALNTWFK